MVYTYENNVDSINLQLQLEEKCKKVQQLEDKVIRLEKVSLLYLILLYFILLYF